MPVAFPAFGTRIRPLGDVHHSINRNVVMLVLMIDRYSFVPYIASSCSPPPYFSAPVSYPKWFFYFAGKQWSLFCSVDASTYKFRSFFSWPGRGGFWRRRKGGGGGGERLSELKKG
jgi:hypothetical protein